MAKPTPAAAVPAAPPIPAEDDLVRIADGTHSGPHSVLGQHPFDGDRVVVRAFRPLAQTVTAVIADLSLIHI